MTWTLGLVSGAAAEVANLQVGPDNNNTENPFVQPQDPALAGGDRNQSLNDGDIQIGGNRDDLLIGLLGIDVQAGQSGDDVMIGGPERGQAPNNDRAFGGHGEDIFIWAPGDGNDFFDGGRGADALVFGLIEQVEVAEGETPPSNPVVIAEATGLPLVDASGSPGFCEVIDGWRPDDAAELEALGLEHLVRFFGRETADAFAAGEQDDNNGLVITMHIRDVEYVVCTVRAGGAIEVFDLRQTPAVGGLDLDDIENPELRARLEQIVS